MNPRVSGPYYMKKGKIYTGSLQRKHTQLILYGISTFKEYPFFFIAVSNA